MDNVKSGENTNSVLGVGLTHSRGVGGVMPVDSELQELEGVSNQLQTVRETPNGRRAEEWVETKLAIITGVAKREPKYEFNNLMHLLTEDFLRRCFWELRREAAPGIDRVTIRKYEKELKSNVADLVRRMKAWQYRPQPVKRVWIPKDEKSKRPLGIPAVEDKLVQMGITKILGAIFEIDFLDVSYGFRPGRGCHQALRALDKTIMFKPVSYILDADIKGYFDNVNHEKLMKCLRQRIADKGLLRLIVRILKSGVMDGGEYKRTEVGTPQGGILSPMLANIYLHYVLDVWFNTQMKGKLSGYAELNRYADDFVICMRYRDDAERVLKAVEERFRKCGLTLSKEKTRLIEFGRYAVERAAKCGKRPETFDYLGFTHYCDKTRKGKFKVGRKTSKKKYRQKLKALNQWLKRIRNAMPLKDWWKILVAKIAGHYQYYGISGNSSGISNYYREAVKLTGKWLGRRSQKDKWSWDKHKKNLERYPLPKPRICHDMYALTFNR